MSEWISVKDRLPVPCKQVCVVWVNHRPEPYYKGIKDMPFVSTAVWYDGEWYWWSELIEELLAEYGARVGIPIDSGIEITHWMPLPVPPKEVITHE